MKFVAAIVNSAITKYAKRGRRCFSRGVLVAAAAALTSLLFAAQGFSQVVSTGDISVSGQVSIENLTLQKLTLAVPAPGIAQFAFGAASAIAGYAADRETARRLDDIDQKLREIASRLLKIEWRLAGIEFTLRGIDEELHNLSAQISSVPENIAVKDIAAEIQLVQAHWPDWSRHPRSSQAHRQLLESAQRLERMLNVLAQSHDLDHYLILGLGSLTYVDVAREARVPEAVVRRVAEPYASFLENADRPLEGADLDKPVDPSDPYPTREAKYRKTVDEQLPLTRTIVPIQCGTPHAGNFFAGDGNSDTQGKPCVATPPAALYPVPKIFGVSMPPVEFVPQVPPALLYNWSVTFADSEFLIDYGDGVASWKRFRATHGTTATVGGMWGIERYAVRGANWSIQSIWRRYGLVWVDNGHFVPGGTFYYPHVLANAGSVCIACEEPDLNRRRDLVPIIQQMNEYGRRAFSGTAEYGVVADGTHDVNAKRFAAAMGPLGPEDAPLPEQLTLSVQRANIALDNAVGAKVAGDAAKALAETLRKKVGAKPVK